MGLSDTSTCFGSSSNIWTKDLFLSYCHWQYYFSAKFCIGAPLQHLIPVQMITSCHFFLLLFPHNPPQKRPFTARSDHRKGLPGPMLMTFSPSQSASSANLLYRHQPCFLSGLQGSQKRHLLLLPSPCHTPDPPQSWLNAGSFPDALRCQDFEGGTRSQKTLVLETYSYSPERKDSLSKPHPFTATQFPFFVSWLKPMPFFFFFSVAWYLAPCCCPYSTPPSPAVSALHLLGTSDTSIFSPLWKNPSQHYWSHWDSSGAHLSRQVIKPMSSR